VHTGHARGGALQRPPRLQSSLRTEPGWPGGRQRVAAALCPRVLSRGLCGGRHARLAVQGGRACTVLAVHPDEPGGAPRRITSATVIEVAQEAASAAAPAAP